MARQLGCSALKKHGAVGDRGILSRKSALAPVHITIKIGAHHE